jgi:hypothetical protein
MSGTTVKGFVLLLCLLVQTARADALGDEVAALKVKLPEANQLSSNDLRQVVALAHTGGIKRVAAIEFRALLYVTAAEVTQGRRISRQEVIMLNDDWGKASSPSPEGEKLGKFSLLMRSYNREWATFAIKGKPTRIECASQVDLNEADKVFAAIDDGRIDYASEEVETRTKRMLRDAPTAFGILFNGEIFIGFPFYGSCADNLEGKWKGERFMILSANTMIACTFVPR